MFICTNIRKQQKITWSLSNAMLRNSFQDWISALKKSSSGSLGDLWRSRADEWGDQGGVEAHLLDARAAAGVRHKEDFHTSLWVSVWTFLSLTLFVAPRAKGGPASTAAAHHLQIHRNAQLVLCLLLFSSIWVWLFWSISELELQENLWRVWNPTQINGCFLLCPHSSAPPPAHWRNVSCFTSELKLDLKASSGCGVTSSRLRHDLRHSHVSWGPWGRGRSHLRAWFGRWRSQHCWLCSNECRRNAVSQTLRPSWLRKASEEETWWFDPKETSGETVHLLWYSDQQKVTAVSE